MVEYPLKFRASAVADPVEDSWTTAADSGERIEVSPPTDFEGSGDEVSPEELFALSIVNCIVSTYNGIAGRKGLSFDGIAADIELVLDRSGDEGRPMMTRAEVDVHVEGVDDVERGEEIAEITDRNCFVSRSVKTEIETDYSFG